MDGTGRRVRAAAAVRRLAAGIAAVAATVLVMTAVVLPGVAVADAVAAELPSVVGLTVAQLEPVLRDWSPTVVITYDPALDQLPSGVDPARVVAQDAGVVVPPILAAVPDPKAPPQVLVRLGALVPDLTGLTSDAAAVAVAPLGLAVAGLPAGAPTGFVAAAQRPLAGTVVGFGRAVVLDLVPGPTAGPTPAPATTGSPPPGRPRRPVLVAAVATGSGVTLAALALVLVGVRRRRIRRRTPVTEDVELHGHPGQVVGPELVDLAPAGVVSVRLEPHADPGPTAVVLLEVWP